MPHALGRIAAERVDAPEALPAFARSTMDGFAVRAAETYGASDSAPAYLRLAGEVAMGRVARDPLEVGTAQRIHTGAMLPPLADAVVIVEDTTLRGSELEVLRAVAPGDNAVAVGEDVGAGEPIVCAGRELRAQDLGALHAAGVTALRVRRRPVVGILSSGDEVVAPDAATPLGAVRDVNAVTVGATVERAGGIPRYLGIVPDDEARLFAAARAGLEACDALVLSAGSSVSARDLTARVVERLGPPGILVHGIALRPGKPTILAVAAGKPVVGLPGNPVSALVVAWRMVRPMVRLLAGASLASGGWDEDRTLDVRLTATVPSRPGREDYVPVALRRAADGALEATPVFGKSSLIFTLVRSDALLVVPLDLAGYAAGSVAKAIVT